MNKKLFIYLSLLLPSIFNIINRALIGTISENAIVTNNLFSFLDIFSEFLLEGSILAIIILSFSNQKPNMNRVSTTINFFFLLSFIISISWIALFFFYNSNTSLDTKLYFIIKNLAIPFNLVFLSLINLAYSLNKGSFSIKIMSFKVCLSLLTDYVLITNLDLVGAGISMLISNVAFSVITFIYINKELDNKILFTIDTEEVIFIFKDLKYILIEIFVRNIIYIYSILFVIHKFSDEEIISYNTLNTLAWYFFLLPSLAYLELKRIELSTKSINVSTVKIIFVSTTLYLITTLFVFLNFENINSLLNSSFEILIDHRLIISIFFYFLSMILTTTLIYINQGHGYLKSTSIISLSINLLIILPLGIMIRLLNLNISCMHFVLILATINLIQFSILLVFVSNQKKEVGL